MDGQDRLECVFTDDTGFQARVTIREVGGALEFTVEVISTGTVGDMRALYFDMLADVDTLTITATGDDITEVRVQEARVSSLGQDTNINGDVIHDYGRFDVGVEFGTMGLAGDDVQSTTFLLSADVPLTLGQLLLQDMGLRVTSVGPEGERDDSLKLGSEGAVLIPGETGNTPPVAVDDAVAGTEDTGFLAGNLLANDSDPDGDTLVVVAAAGLAPGAAIAVSAVSSLGRMLDGSVTVSANGAWTFTPGAGYEAMALGESVVFSLGYSIEDPFGASDQATLTITIDGLNEAPDATANDYIVQAGTGLTGNLMTEDTGAGTDGDVNGDAIAVTGVALAGQALGTLGEAWTVTTAGGREGTLTVGADGGFTFVQGAGFETLATGQTDTISLDYTIADIHGATDSARLDITILGDSGGGGGGGGGGGPVINVAFVVDISSSMFIDNLSAMPVGDVNGDGVANTGYDVAWAGLTQLYAALQAEAAVLGMQLNVGLVGFDDLATAAFTCTDATALQAWGEGEGTVFQEGDAGDSDATAGLAEAAAWFAAIGAAPEDDNQIVLLSDGQFTSADAAAILADWTAATGGTVHSRFTAPLTATANFAAVEAVEALSTDAVTPYDADGRFYIYDLPSAAYALQAADILDFV